MTIAFQLLTFQQEGLNTSDLTCGHTDSLYGSKPSTGRKTTQHCISDIERSRARIPQVWKFRSSLMSTPVLPSTTPDTKTADAGFKRGLGLFDSTMIVVGVMIGSGIFIVSAEMAREIGSAGWLLVAWAFAGMLTVAGALAYGELAAMMPRAGGMYVYLREAFSPMWGFLYGWTLCAVIQTGTIAAVAIAFSRFAGVFFPSIS